ncbi:MAG: stage V sporulation protein AD [Clostridia bacterium]|nr:stage V sporulation protein AD [Clostridia bacterium]
MRTMYFKNNPSILATSSIGGPKETTGALGKYIEIKGEDDTFGETTYEKAEKQMLYTVIKNSIQNAHKEIEDIDAIIAGDLLDQIISATFSARSFDAGYLGVYNACATFTEALTIGAALVDGGYLKSVVCGTSSHFSSAERQYRYPLELGCTRPPQAQWTVTGAGACVLGNGDGVKINCATVGKVVDFGVVDVNNMGAAMAPAAADTLYTHFIETGRTPDYYDAIISGDLGVLGSHVLIDLMWQKGFDISKVYHDCGAIVYKIKEKEYQGGSGAGCSSMVFCSYFYKQLCEKSLKRVLLMSTGALLSSLSAQQGESIPGIAHAVCIES